MRSQSWSAMRCLFMSLFQAQWLKHFKVTDEQRRVAVEGDKDAQITVQLENDTDYEVYVDDVAVGSMKTNMSGKLSVS